MKVGEYLHTRLRVNDLATSLRFYTQVLGLEIRERHTSPRGSQLVFLHLPGSTCDLELCSFPDSGGVDVPEDLVHLAFKVDSVEEWAARLERFGAPVTEGPVRTQSGSAFIFTEDPDRYEIELIQPAPGK
ncbi:MAG: VOC family protein [Nitrospinaceae bacterium]